MGRRTQIAIVLFSVGCRLREGWRRVRPVLAWVPLRVAEGIASAWLSRPTWRQLKLHLFTKHELTSMVRDYQEMKWALASTLAAREAELRDLRVQHKLTLQDLRAAVAELGQRTKEPLEEYLDTAKRKSLIRPPLVAPLVIAGVSAEPTPGTQTAPHPDSDEL